MRLGPLHALFRTLPGRLRDGCRSGWEKFSELIESSRPSAGLLAIVLVLGVFVIGHIAQAGPLDDLSKFIVNMLGTILGYIISFLGSLVILAAEMVIAFAGYNNFVNSQPVVTGWKLVRDVANMFFIVVLLVSAFATIIGYEKGTYHYSKVLPKLLAMAVLINFSKMLVGLLIDFSQVVMLTFVNAFRQAAGGNFVMALKLDKIMQMKQSSDGGTNPYDTASLLISAMLAIFMLSLALSVLVIMIAYLVARIVGLWLLLIISPMAFLGTALPGPLKSARGPVTSEFWKKLSSLLVGGPIMAFFLWLALAIVQTSDTVPFGEAFAAESGSAMTNFATVVGSASEISSFIIGISIMLMGVKYAVDTATAVGGATAGAFAKRAASGGGVGMQLLRGARNMGTGAAKKGVTLAARTETGEQLAKKGLVVANKFGVGQTKMAELAGERQKAVKDKQKSMTGFYAGMTGEQKREQLLRDTKSFDPVTRQSAVNMLGEESMSAGGVKTLAAVEMKKLKGRKDMAGKSEADLEAMAQDRARVTAAGHIATLKKSAEASGDQATLDKIKDAIKKQPGLGEGHTHLEDRFNSDPGTNPGKYFNSVPLEELKDSASMAAVFGSLGLTEGADGLVESEGFKQVRENMEARGGERAELFKAHLQRFRDNKGSFNTVVSAIQGEEGAAAKADAFRARAHMGKDKNVSMVLRSDSLKNPETRMKRNEGTISAGRTRLASMLREAKDDPERRAQIFAGALPVQRDMVKAGARLGEAFNFNVDEGTFREDVNIDNFGKVTSSMATAIKSGDREGLQMLEGLDTDGLAMNAKSGNFNMARNVAFESMSPDVIEQAYMNGNEAVEGKASSLLKMAERDARTYDSDLGSMVEKYAAGSGGQIDASEMTGMEKLAYLRKQSAAATGADKARMDELLKGKEQWIQSKSVENVLAINDNLNSKDAATREKWRTMQGAVSTKAKNAAASGAKKLGKAALAGAAVAGVASMPVAAAGVGAAIVAGRAAAKGAKWVGEKAQPVMRNSRRGRRGDTI